MFPQQIERKNRFLFFRILVELDSPLAPSVVVEETLFLYLNLSCHLLSRLLTEFLLKVKCKLRE